MIPKSLGPGQTSRTATRLTASVAKSKSEAKKLGLTSVFDQYKSRTGTIAVVDADGETVTVFKGVSDPERYDDAIGQACTS